MDLLHDNMEETAEESTFETLPVEILIDIFSFLPPAEALKMYDVSKRCRDVLAMDLRFGPDLNKITIRNFGGEDKMSFRRKKRINYAHLEGIGFILRFLRVFWHKILVIHVGCLGSDVIWQKIVFWYIIEYRRSEIINLSFSYLSTDFDFEIQPFEKVVCFRVKSCYLSTYLSNISSLFPNVKNVEFLEANVIEDMAIHKIIRFSLPRLRYMRVSPQTFSKIYFELMQILNPHVFYGYHDRK